MFVDVVDKFFVRLVVGRAVVDDQAARCFNVRRSFYYIRRSGPRPFSQDSIWASSIETRVYLSWSLPGYQPAFLYLVWLAMAMCRSSFQKNTRFGPRNCRRYKLGRHRRVLEKCSFKQCEAVTCFLSNTCGVLYRDTRRRLRQLQALPSWLSRRV